ncbi:HAMP domain-containing histidine kinase, partial [Aduncisulcus paluster]
YVNTLQLEDEVLLVERSDDLSNLILEIRRIEKNYLLYHDPALFTLGLDYLKRADVLLQELMGEFKKLEKKQTGKKLELNLENYRKLLLKLKAAPKRASTENKELNDHLRETGQAMVGLSKAISNFERKYILSINRELRSNLTLSMIGIALVIMALVIFFSSNILKPLREVQEATRKISEGKFKPLPIKNSHDEIQQVFAALNSMVEQLVK